MLKKSSAFLLTLFLTVVITKNVIANEPSPDTPPLPVIHETSLSAIPEGYRIISHSIKYSPDLRMVAFAAYSDDTHKIVSINGKQSPVYYTVLAGTPIFSAAQNHYAYIAYKTKDKCVVVLDGKASPVIDDADNFLFSPDGSRYAWRGQKNKKQFVSVDGTSGPAYDGIVILKNFMFSPDSTHFIYVAYKDKKCVLVFDEKEESLSFPLIQDTLFSFDSKHYAYKARVEKKGSKEKWCVVRDGHPETVYDRIFDIVFSQDSKHMAYSAIKKGRMVMVYDGKEVAEGDMVGFPIFSAKSFVYSIMHKPNWYFVIDNHKGPAFDRMYKFSFSFDSNKYSYIAARNKQWTCVVNGEKGPEFKIGIDDFHFSLDSSRYAYVGVNPEGSRVVTDSGVLPETYKSVGTLYFSPDSKHLVFRAIIKSGKNWITVLDGKDSSKSYSAIGKYQFSPDSKHLAVPVLNKSLKQSFMSVDGNEECTNSHFDILGDPYFSPDGNYLVYHAGKADKEEWNLIVNGIVTPNTYSGFMKGTPIIFDSANHFHTLALKGSGPEFVLIEADIPDNYPKITSGL